MGLRFLEFSIANCILYLIAENNISLAFCLSRVMSEEMSILEPEGAVTQSGMHGKMEGASSLVSSLAFCFLLSCLHYSISVT